MHRNHKDFVRIQGYVLIVLAVSMIIPLVLAYMYNEDAAASGFLYTLLLSGGFGVLIVLLVKPSTAKVKARMGFLIVTVTWLVCSVTGALPFIFSGAIPDFADAFFESVSGFSTTGASILTDIEAMPKSILFWRSFTHWLGGMGIIVFVMALLPALGINGQTLAYAETPGPIKDKVTARFYDNAKSLYLLYVAITLILVILLRIGKMSWYDAFIHAFGTVGTGGFSNYNASIAHFDSTYIEIVLIVFMALSGINFSIYYLGLSHKRLLKTILHDHETKFYLHVLSAASLLIFIYNFAFSGFDSPGQKLLDSVFHVVSIVTTTGFASGDYDLWPTFSKMILFALFFFGGCSGSTGGGVKHIRILVALKLLRRSFSLKIHPKRVIPVTINDRDITSDIVIRITNFIFLYIVTLFVGVILISADNMDFVSTVSASATCLGNVGPGFGLVGPSMNFAALSDFTKYVCSFLMIAGRLELFTVFTLFSKYYWNSNRA